MENAFTHGVDQSSKGGNSADKSTTQLSNNSAQMGSERFAGRRGLSIIVLIVGVSVISLCTQLRQLDILAGEISGPTWEGGAVRLDNTTDIFSDLPVTGCNIDLNKLFCSQFGQDKKGRKYWSFQQSFRYHLPKLAAAFRKAGIPPIIAHGTFLGFYRECRPVAGDGDADMWILRHFFETRKDWARFRQIVNVSGYKCRTSHQKFGEAGWQVLCKVPDNGVGFDIQILDEDFFTHGCQQAPCKWTDYLSLDKNMFRGVVGPFGFQLAAWQNTTVWVPDVTPQMLEPVYGPRWMVPRGTNYDHYKVRGSRVPRGRANSSFKNRLQLSPQEVVALQDRLEIQFAEQISASHEQQIRLLEWCSGDCVWHWGVCIPKAEFHQCSSSAANLGVSCGVHRANCCSECPKFECQGDCMLVDDECTDKFEPHINCGDYKARNCSGCPVSKCMGDCRWLQPVNSGKAGECIGNVSCGNHLAKSCSECPHLDRGDEMCGGHCVWLVDRCVERAGVIKWGTQNSHHTNLAPKAAANHSGVSCGEHRATSCSVCPRSHGLVWCRGDCVWFEDECIEMSRLAHVEVRSGKTCSLEGHNFGPDVSPGECLGEASRNAKCGAYIIYPASAGTRVWGCRCCSRDWRAEEELHPGWQLMSATPQDIRAIKVGFGLACSDRGPNLGSNFNNPSECLRRAGSHSDCGETIMWAPKNPYWGCRCCSPKSNAELHSNWLLVRFDPHLNYKIKVQAGTACSSQTAILDGLTPLDCLNSARIKRECGRRQRVMWSPKHFSVWACRCCSETSITTKHQGWELVSFHLE